MAAADKILKVTIAIAFDRRIEWFRRWHGLPCNFSSRLRPVGQLKIINLSNIYTAQVCISRIFFKKTIEQRYSWPSTSVRTLALAHGSYRMIFGHLNSILIRGCLCMAVIVSVAGCDRGNTASTGGGPATLLTAKDFIGETVLPNSEYLAAEPYSSANLKLGERVAMQCRACHSLHEGGAIMVGPNLFGVFGREAASNAEFGYSAALQNSNLVWSPAALDAWLVNPAQFLPGNRMPIAGIRDKEERNSLIAYLLTEAKKSSADDTAAN
jgi:cytochrome c